MARTRLKAKGRRSGQGYSQLIHAYFESQEYAELSPRAVKALIDIFCQYRGANNGDLCAAISIMRARGWRSKDQLAKAIEELLEKGWLMVTRQGGRHLATLYAVTFMSVDACGGKLDVKATVTPPHFWKRPAPVPMKLISLPRSTGHIAPPRGASMTA